VDARTSRAAVPRTRTRTTDWFFRPLSAANVVWRFCRARLPPGIEIKRIASTLSLRKFSRLLVAIPDQQFLPARPRRNRAGRKASGSGVPGISIRPLSSNSQLCQCPMQRKSSCARVCCVPGNRKIVVLAETRNVRAAVRDSHLDFIFRQLRCQFNEFELGSTVIFFA